MLQREGFERIEEQVLAPYGMRSAASRGRAHSEEEHPLRTAFQRDRDRVVHSTAFRRLEYKTQVFVNHEGDYYRTRLTHTIETAQIARTIARALRLNSDLTEAIALAHDLGHTPFGHAGERALNELMRDHGGFEHNAQSLRIVDALEQRYPEFRGLNLTWEVREGIIKHSLPYDKPLARDFEPGRAPCLEAQIVDFADEIAYNSHDLDDGLKSGLLSYAQLDDVELWAGVYGEAQGRSPDAPQHILRYQAVRRLIDLLVTDLLQATLKGMRTEHVLTCAQVRHIGRPTVRFSAGLDAQRLGLKGFLLANLYRHPRVLRMTRKGQEVIENLFGGYTQEPDQLPAHILARQKECGESLPRAIADYIAGMTDRFAIQESHRLFDPLDHV